MRVCVRAYVCLSRFFSETVHYFFSETLQLVRACKCEKNVPSAFLIIFTVFAILAKNWSKLAIWLDVWMCLFKGWKSLKNLKVGVFETDFKQVPFVFQQTTCEPALTENHGFIGVPRTLNFGRLSLYFDNFYARKLLEVKRSGETACCN